MTLNLFTFPAVGQNHGRITVVPTNNTYSSITVVRISGVASFQQAVSFFMDGMFSTYLDCKN